LKSEIALKYEAVDILVKKLGLVDVKRFIATIKKDSFDYTKMEKRFI